MSRTLVGPFPRIEGDLELSLESESGQVSAAYVTAPMFRGFEGMLQGQNPMDALIIAPRICGICSVSQSLAARNALNSLCGLNTPPNAQLVFNLMQGAENLSDLFSHGYLYFLPELASSAFKDRPWSAEAVRRFGPKGRAWHEAVEIRAAILGMLSPLAGKWPHSISLLPGGIAKETTASERLDLLDRLGRVLFFLERRTFGGPVAEFLALKTPKDLSAWAEAHADSDLGFWLSRAFEEGWDQMGRAETGLLSLGAYGEPQGPTYGAGVWQGRRGELDLLAITEDLASSWLEGPEAPLPPSQGVTELKSDRPGGYSYNKAPRYLGQPMAVGPLARQVLDGQPLVSALFEASGQNLFTRILARWVEVGRVALDMRRWLGQLNLKEPFYLGHPAEVPDGAAYGLVEAARGSLLHFMEVTEGKISRYQLIAPTSWNFSPRDGQGQPGPAELALEGLPFEGRPSPEVWMVVRSFDPCMQCTVH